MTNFIEESNYVTNHQAGFQKGISHLFQSFSLTQIIESTKEPVFVAFTDINQAFDKVCRNILWRHLFELGVRGKILHMLFDMYSSATYAIHFLNQVSECIRPSNGLRQGCTMSPLLFSLFIQILLNEIVASNIGFKLGNIFCGCLAFADDICLICQSASDLQKLLDICNNIAYKRLHLTFNASESKTEVIIFNIPPDHAAQYSFKLGDLNISIVSSYKHLGTRIKQNKSFALQVQDRIQKADSCFWSLVSKKVFYGLTFQQITTIYNSFVLPVMLANCAVYGPSLTKEQLQQMTHTHFYHCRYLLGLNRVSCAHAAISGESGWFTIESYIAKFSLLLMGQILTAKKDSLAKQIILYLFQENIKTRWILGVTHLIEKFSLGPIIANLDNMEKWKANITEGIIIAFKAMWSNEIRKPHSTLPMQFYSQVCTTFGPQVYLQQKFAKTRHFICALKTNYVYSNAFLRVEPTCEPCNSPLNSMHIMLSCTKYSVERQIFQNDLISLLGRNLFEQYWTQPSRISLCQSLLNFSFGPPALRPKIIVFLLQFFESLMKVWIKLQKERKSLKKQAAKRRQKRSRKRSVSNKPKKRSRH